MMVAKLVEPLKTLTRVVASIPFMLKTVVKYTKRFIEVPNVPSFSNVSFPAYIVGI